MKKYFQAAWDLKDLAVIILIFIFGSGLALALFEYLDLETVLKHSTHPSLIIIGTLLLQWTIIIFLTIIYGKHRHKITAKQLLITKFKPFRHISAAILAYLFFIFIAIILTIIILYTGIESLPGFSAQERVLPHFGDSQLDLIIAGIAVVIVAPIVEELYFRGIILTAVVNFIGRAWGSIVVALAFAAVHFQFNSMIPLIILGLIINHLAIKHRSIWPGVIFHMINNSIVLTYELLLMNGAITI